MSQVESPASNDDNDLRSIRRGKAQKLAALGVDPWGGRFDDRSAIAEVRAQEEEIYYQLEAGDRLPLPRFDQQPEGFNFRQWKADAGKGEMVGPRVRVAGRIVLHRDKGKLHFIDVRDMTGDIQLMIGMKQVGGDWPVVEQLDLGDIIGVDGMLGRTNTGELSIFAERIHFLTKSLETPP
ncbi:MAG: OB-fold nucleic acid binding domain-containing protein [Planctomycetota bacterium]